MAEEHISGSYQHPEIRGASGPESRMEPLRETKSISYPANKRENESECVGHVSKALPVFDRDKTPFIGTAPQEEQQKQASYGMSLPYPSCSLARNPPQTPPTT
ncbi:hypothetical protein AVEN_247962-1 [Araneus ventricosus]|uniref:Uncharacterized protein n=1 Tax=Araneus ventricosus TaxID=182803 RepID=A0A4Y2CIA3_ARAVE|nr:hypothetical protein AVEN_247962-1 [Araneus ventricosus]